MDKKSFSERVFVSHFHRKPLDHSRQLADDQIIANVILGNWRCETMCEKGCAMMRCHELSRYNWHCDMMREKGVRLISKSF